MADEPNPGQIPPTPGEDISFDFELDSVQLNPTAISLQAISLQEFLDGINTLESGVQAPAQWTGEPYNSGWKFWKKNADAPLDPPVVVDERVRSMVDRIVDKFNETSAGIVTPCLIQYWKSVKIGKEHWLTTSEETFYTFGSFTEGMMQYRRLCMNEHSIKVGEVFNEEELGPVGRAFTNKCMESSPDSRFYHSVEHPLKDKALDLCVKTRMNSPIFAHVDSTNKVMGVLELSTMYTDSVDDKAESQNSVLRSTLEGEVERQIAGVKCCHIDPALLVDVELSELLEKAIDGVPNLQLAQIWNPCRHCPFFKREAYIAVGAHDRQINSMVGCNDDIAAYIKLGEFENVSKRGMLSITSLSPNKACYCWNICSLRIQDYPMAHYAQQANLSFWAAIYLQRAEYQNDNDYRVLELLMTGTNDGDHLAYVDGAFKSIFAMVDNLTTFKLLSVEQRSPAELVTVLGDKYHFGTYKNLQPAPRRQLIGRQVLQKFLGNKSMSEVANELHVSLEDIKYSKDFHRIKWPRKRSTGSDISKSYASASLTKRSRSSLAGRNDLVEIVVVFKNFEHGVENIIRQVRFEFPTPWTMKALKENLALRSGLAADTFIRIKYKDPQGGMTDLLLQESQLADSDLKVCINTIRSHGNDCINLLVESIPAVAPGANPLLLQN